MVQVVTGSARFTRERSTSVVLRVLSSRDHDSALPSHGEATFRLSIADATLEKAIARSVVKAVVAAVPEASLDIPIARFKTEKRLECFEKSDELRRAIAIIAVTPANSRRLVEYVDRALAAGAVGAQLVWDGVTPSRARAEAHVFAALEKARARPQSSPVVLSRNKGLLEILVLTARARLAQNEEKR